MWVVALFLALLTGLLLGSYLEKYRARWRLTTNLEDALDILRSAQDEKPRPKRKPEVYYVNSPEELERILKELGLDDDPDVKEALALPKPPREDLQ